MNYLASLLAAIFCGLALLHGYWALGGRAGADAAVPEVPARHGLAAPLFRPSRAGTWAVALALLLAALLVLGCAGLLKLPLAQRGLQWGIAGIGALMLLRGVGDGRWVGLFKRVRGTRFALLDTWVYAPLCLLIGTGLMALAWA